MKCKKHVVEVVVGDEPTIEVSIKEGDIDSSWDREILADAKLTLVCRKCGQTIELSASDNIFTYVGG